MSVNDRFRIPPSVSKSLAEPSGRTDIANAVRLVSRFREDIRWVSTWDKWVIWDTTRWKLDADLRIHAMAKEAATDQWKFIAESGSGLDDRTIRNILTWRTYSSSAHGVRSAILLAQSESGVAIGVDELDRDPWLLNLSNGTLDLQTGQLCEHRRDDLITRIASGVVFNQDAKCPQWNRFLRTIFADRVELVDYVRRLVGYCLTGSTEEHVLPFLFGDGANGKSTFVETVLKLIGSDYGMKAAPDLLMAKKGESHPTDRADLFGKRFVACVETGQGKRLAESLVKELTGGDRVRARRMREDFWEFAPTHHVWLASNHKPAVHGTDKGIWRRIKLIPFDVSIPESEQDKKLPAKLAAELPGILNWAIKGCLDWQRDGNGLNEPDCVKSATEQYSQEMDEVGLFIEDCCDVSPQFRTGATELLTFFRDAFPESKLNQHTFGARLQKKGFVNRDPVTGNKVCTSKGKSAWLGLRLKPSMAQPKTPTKSQVKMTEDDAEAIVLTLKASIQNKKKT